MCIHTWWPGGLSPVLAGKIARYYTGRREAPLARDELQRQIGYRARHSLRPVECVVAAARLRRLFAAGDLPQSCMREDLAVVEDKC